MKKIIYILAGMFAIGCTSDAKQETEVLLKDLTPEIVVKQSKEVQPDVLQNNKITLEQGKAYSVSVIFKEDVQLQKGNFLKVKQKTAKEYYADFYGANNNDISEEVVFKKEGFRDYSLQIVQPKVVADKYYAVRQNPANFTRFLTDENNKIIWILNQEDVDLQIEFIAPVFLENVQNQEGEEIISVEKLEEGGKYNIRFSGEIIENIDALQKLPIYEMQNGQKGNKIGEIEFRPDPLPQNMTANTFYTPQTFDTFSYRSAWNYSNQISMNFGIFGKDEAVIFIENINEELVIEHTLNRNQIDFTMNNQKIRQKGKYHFFDVYEGELNNGVVVKKTNAKKREIFFESI